jgi:sugar-phosphatase
MITADDVENGKPHPEPYLKGAKLLGVSPAECVVIEDAPSGVRSAQAAGMKTIAVPTTYAVQDLQGADAIAADLASLSADASNGVIRLVVRGPLE